MQNFLKRLFQNNKGRGDGGLFFLLILAGIGYYMYSQHLWIFSNTQTTPNTVVNPGNTYQPTYNNSPQIVAHSNVKLLSWNLQAYGNTKANNPTLMEIYTTTMKQFDIIIVQEIRNAGGTAWYTLCSQMSDYNCIISSRAGRTTVKEQYGILYKKGIDITAIHDFNPDESDRWERPPYEVKFEWANYSLTLYTLHAKPEDVRNELVALQNLIEDKGNIVIMGDLNADCDYFNNILDPVFANWTWAIKDNVDTTTSMTNCAYDRIIYNSDAAGEYVDSGVWTYNITNQASDHYPVWVEFVKDEKNKVIPVNSS